MPTVCLLKVMKEVSSNRKTCLLVVLPILALFMLCHYELSSILTFVLTNWYLAIVVCPIDCSYGLLSILLLVG